MAASQNNLTLVINQQDTNGVSILNRTIGAISFAGTVGQFSNGILITGATTLSGTGSLPTANIYQFLFQNNHASSIVTITATKQGGTGAIVDLVGPSGVFAIWGQTSGSTEGYTSITLNPSVSGTPYHMFLGG